MPGSLCAALAKPCTDSTATESCLARASDGLSAPGVSLATSSTRTQLRARSHRARPPNSKCRSGRVHARRRPPPGRAQRGAHPRLPATASSPKRLHLLANRALVGPAVETQQFHAAPAQKGARVATLSCETVLLRRRPSSADPWCAFSQVLRLLAPCPVETPTPLGMTRVPRCDQTGNPACKARANRPAGPKRQIE